MKRYIEHIKNTRTTHERRNHAMQVAGALTAVVFVVWLTTLGLRFGANSGDASQTAAAADAENSTLNGLVVASSTNDY